MKIVCIIEIFPHVNKLIPSLSPTLATYVCTTSPLSRHLDLGDSLNQLRAHGSSQIVLEFHGKMST